MKRPRILLVEDRPAVLRALESVLEARYHVVTARDGKSALDGIESAGIDVIVTDIRMPGCSGFDVLRASRARSPRTRVVMMTAYAAVPDAVAAVKLGAFDYVAKPIDADEILLVVARAVECARNGSRAACLDVGGPVDGPARQPPLPDVAGGFRTTIENARARASREYLIGLMELFHGNVSHAAAWAGLTRESLHRVLKKYLVQSEDFRDGSGKSGVASLSSRIGDP